MFARDELCELHKLAHSALDDKSYVQELHMFPRVELQKVAHLRMFSKGEL